MIRRARHTAAMRFFHRARRRGKAERGILEAMDGVQGPTTTGTSSGSSTAWREREGGAVGAGPIMVAPA